ncbi:MAG: peptidoglycan-binding protein [Nodosilinea sp.]
MPTDEPNQPQQASVFRPPLGGGARGLAASLALTGLAVFLASGPGQGQETVAPITASQPLLQAGATGPEVAQLQATLAQLELYSGTIDGIYGPATVQAIQAFQQQQGLVADGTIGPQTRQALALSAAPTTALDNLQVLTAASLGFTPLTVALPDQPPSPFWLALMPLVPVIGGGLTYLRRQLQGPTPSRRRRRRKRQSR